MTANGNECIITGSNVNSIKGNDDGSVTCVIEIDIRTLNTDDLKG